jgi:hypothetical protein
MSKHILEAILNTQEPDPNIAREFEELKTALAPILTPGAKVMRLGYAQPSTKTNDNPKENHSEEIS